MTGIFYGIGVGPGDPELLTLKAVRLLKSCDCLALPADSREQCTAYGIAQKAVEELEGKECLFLHFPMTKDPDRLRESHERAAETVMEQLARGRNVAFITLGDSSIYSTYLYVERIVEAAGYETELVSGVPSFCAAAARLGTALCSGSEQLHVIPASYQVEEAIKLPGVKVLMKAGRQMEQVIRLLREQNADVTMVENCGMEGERIYCGLEHMPEEAGYYSLLIVR